MDHLREEETDTYFSKKRLSRWPAVLQLGSEASYKIEYTGTPPQR